MNRELKFRAWDGEIFLYLDINKDFTEIDKIEWLQVFQRLEKQQYTGLKDRNGKEIYEGDMPNGIYKGMYIQWCNQCASFALFLNNRTYTSCENDIFWNEFLDDINEIEITGNIYENPELLGE